MRLGGGWDPESEDNAITGEQHNRERERETCSVVSETAPDGSAGRERGLAVSSVQSQTDHSATQRGCRVAQQDAWTRQAEVKPKLSVGVAYPTVQLSTATSWRDMRRTELSVIQDITRPYSQLRLFRSIGK